MSEARRSAGHARGSVAERDRFAARFEEVGLAEDRFINVSDGGKRSPVEHSDASNRRADPTEIEGNYGVYAGDGLALFDVDDYEDGVDASALALLDGLPDTLTVASPHTDGETGGHRLYHVVPGEEYDSAVAACSDVWDDTKNPIASWGELRNFNQYVVGPGSQLDGCDKDGCERCAGPDGGRYQIADYRKIATITADQLADVLRQDPKRPTASEEQDADGDTGGKKPLPDPDPVQYDRDAAAIVEAAVREFGQARVTTGRAFAYVTGLSAGDYAEWGHGDDRSRAELDLASKLFGVLRFTGDAENARERIASFISEMGESHPTTDTGERRKWVDSARWDGYRAHTVDAAIATFDQERFDRWQRKKDDPHRHTGEYGEPMFRYVLRAVQVTYEERPGYPTKDDVLDAAQGLDPNRSRGSHGNVLGELKNEREQVKMAYCPDRSSGERYLWYPASEPDPPNARHVEIGGEEYDPGETPR